MIAATQSKRERMIWGISLHGWEDVMRTSLAIVGAVGLMVGLATWFVVKLQREELAASKIEFDKYKVEAGEEIAAANALGEAAKRDAATANLEAARLRWQLDQEIQKRAPRFLSEEQKSGMLAEMKGQIPVIALVVQNDLEARAFSFQFVSLFQDAGAKPIYAPEAPPEDKWWAPAGLMMYSPTGTNEDTLKDDPLYRALKAANLFGGTTARPFISGSPRPVLTGQPPVPVLPEIPGYNGHVLYIGQKSPF
jgi:hypothetical protein